MNSILKNKQLGNVLVLSLGTIGAQLVNLLGQIIITRIYTPGVLGQFTLILSYSSLIVPISSLKMEMKLVAAESRKEANEITYFSIVLSFIISSIYFVFILLTKFLGLNFFEKIGSYVYFIPLIIFCNGLRYIFISYSNFENEYKKIGHYQFLRELIFVSFQIFLGFVWPNTLVIVILYIVSPLIGIKNQGAGFFVSFRKEKRYIKEFYYNFSKYKSHMVFQVPGQFANSLSFTIITLTIAKIASESDIAFYSFSVRILMIPLILISTNLSKIYMKELSSYRVRKKDFAAFHFKVSFILLFLSVVGFTFLYVVSPQLMEFLFGDAYRRSGYFISKLCLMYSVRFITSTLVGAYIVFNKQSVDFIFQLALCLIGLLLYLYASRYNISTDNYISLVNYSYGFVYLINYIYITIIIKSQNKITN